MRYPLLVCCASVLLSACGGGDSAPVTPSPTPAPDNTAPVITLTGAATLNHEQGTVFSDPGASASDNVDGSVAVSVSGSVGSAAGTYTLTYSASDSAGNTATQQRTVIVADTIAPTVTLLGQPVVMVELGSEYIEAGATAQDTVDGAVNVIISGSVDTQTVASYTLQYEATDTAGNSTNISRVVHVREATATTNLMVLSQGAAVAPWDAGLNAFDEAIGYAECNNDGGAACPGISWQTVNDSERGEVLEIQHASSGSLAGFFVKSSTPVDTTSFRDGALLFDLKTIAGDGLYTMKLDCSYPCTSGDQQITFAVDANWTQITVPLATLEQAGLNLTKVNTGIVIWATTHNGNQFRLDNVRFESTYSGESSIAVTTPPANNVDYTLTQLGAASYSDTINPASYRCVYDYGNWIYSAGVVAPGVADCDTSTGKPIGEPTPLLPHVVGQAAQQPVAAHRWWGSVSFIGEMTIGDPNRAGYITPDPITARISNTGFRMMGIPSGLNVYGIDFGYRIPDPFAEVFDGIAIANSGYNALQAYATAHSDGSVTVEWQQQNEAIMHATFVHGSPYVFVDVFKGDLQLKTLRENGGEKGVFFTGDSSLGIWTSVAGNTNYYLITGDGPTSFSNPDGNVIGVSNATKSYTIALLPTQSNPAQAMIELFEQYARNKVASVRVDYSVDNTTQAVDITQRYLDADGSPVTTLAGLQPLHWKHITSTLNASAYQTRSARGITKFAALSSFTYQLPNVGILPALPTFTDDMDVPALTALVDEFIAIPSSQWNSRKDTYWAGKNYGKVAELIAIADGLNLTTQKQQLLAWLKAELEDWFTAQTNDNLDEDKYFAYDDTWNTLLGMEESFAAHQQLNDHHFHYGYFVRAAAEICRNEPAWCRDDQYGQMVKLLIRDYAGDRDDPMFPYLRHFDPTNGFSWASGNVNFARGNNNESTSEAANAYGAMVLFGLITGDTAITERGLYLHASTAAAYWQYWNNIDGYRGGDAENDNFPAGYDGITTSIVWGDGAVFSTWFSGAYAHILGIQGLPTNALNLHIGVHADYLQDYVSLGLDESSNGRPSGLVNDQWRDIWWNIWAMTDATSSIEDYESASPYEPEAGETKAHTYHWLHTFKKLGQMAMGTGALTADYPAAVAFNKNGVLTYVVYNFGATQRTVTFSNGTQVIAEANNFTVLQP
ncbi:glycosyl hydrolase [Bowmanella sp. JS7-9]|uniref:glucan endo-1,3-beta-D-glucosidase n=1 Tax=Pseudobowmanella zhangzhouensis TaxID=1537679 RepID=A0ABW1XN56_9ALTE|nr:glycosyl hydrolase [Bowmanella sp. JS7-9]